MNEENNVFYILNKLYSTKGRDKNCWKNLLINIKNFPSYEGIIQYFNQRMINEPSNTLTLDILDFLIDYSSIELLRELSKIDIMINFFNLLKKSSGSGLEVQKKGIYLTKKWFDISNKYDQENFEGFIRNYKELYKKGISFPPPGYKLNTYEQYISIYEINNILSNLISGNNRFNNKFSDNNFINNNIINHNNNKINFINNSNITPFEQESNYNKNDDIPSNDIPKLNNNSNYESHKLYNDNKEMNNINNYGSYDMKIDNNFSIENNINQKEYFQDFNENNIPKEEKYENPFSLLNNNENDFSNEMENKFSDLKNSSSNQKQGINNNNNDNNDENENIERSVYPEYEEIKKSEILNGINGNNGDNNNIIEKGYETPIGMDLFCAPDIKNTPLGNKNPLPMTNKSYNTIYNNGFKSYMDVKYENPFKNNNNNINNNFYNNINNSVKNENNNFFNKPKENYNNQKEFNEINNMNETNNTTYLYKHSWMTKISMYNEWINQGSNDTNSEKLKTGIKNILYEFNKIESLLQKYNKDGDFESVSIILKLKSDMNQTCYRYERFIINQSYDKFYSAFDGNIKVYNFNKDYLLTYIDSNKENSNKYVEGLKKFGGVMKKGIFTAGKVVKENTVKGFNFVKEKVEKVHKDKNNNQNNDINNNSKNKVRHSYNANINDFSNSSDFTYFNKNNLNNNQINDYITPNPFNDKVNIYDNPYDDDDDEQENND